LAEAIEAIAAFADPILSGDVTSGRWDPVTRRWRPADGDLLDVSFVRDLSALL
jgi:hypothetical protein